MIPESAAMREAAITLVHLRVRKAGLLFLVAAMTLSTFACSALSVSNGCGASSTERTSLLRSIKRLEVLETVVVSATVAPRARHLQRWGIQSQSAYDEPPWLLMPPYSDDECANTLIAAPMSSTDNLKMLLIEAIGFHNPQSADRYVADKTSIRGYAATAQKNGLAAPLVGMSTRREGVYYCAVGFVPRCHSWALLTKIGPRVVMHAAIYSSDQPFPTARATLLKVRAGAIGALRR